MYEYNDISKEHYYYLRDNLKKLNDKSNIRLYVDKTRK